MAAPPVLLLLVGLPGTGKSYFAEAVRARHRVEIVRSDEVRKALFRSPTYSPGESGVVYQTCYQLVRELLEEAHHVIFDATNTSESGRRRVYHLAEETGARLLIVLTEAPPDEVSRRLAARAAGKGPTFQSDATWPIYERMAPQLESIGRPYLVVDTSRDLPGALEVIDRFFAGEPVDLCLRHPAAAPAPEAAPPARQEASVVPAEGASRDGQ